MITMNSTVKFTYRNTGTFFGVHVTSTPFDLSYSDIVIATGNVSIYTQIDHIINLIIWFDLNWCTTQLKKFYQSRKSQRLVSVAVMGNKIPLYGGGASLSSSTGVPTLPVPLNLTFVIRSRAYVLGRLVKPKYYKRVQCSINLDPKKINVPISLKHSCTYDWLSRKWGKELRSSTWERKIFFFTTIPSWFVGFLSWLRKVMCIQLIGQDWKDACVLCFFCTFLAASIVCTDVMDTEDN